MWSIPAFTVFVLACVVGLLAAYREKFGWSWGCWCIAFVSGYSGVFLMRF